MYKIILLLLLYGSFVISNADSAIQTDWSGGQGLLGPVSEWNNRFYSAIDVHWSIPGSIMLPFPAEQTVDDDFDGNSVYSEDIDSDGDMDILGAGDYTITWWENADGSGSSWIEHIVDGDFNSARSVYSEDIDGDGYMDILGAGGYDIIWWENTDGSGSSWIKHTVDGDFDGARSVYSADINSDGYMDILGAAFYADDITWWENIDGSGTSWIEHTISWDFDGATSIYPEDMDGDGDIDVLGAAEKADDITWWENINGSGTSWIEHTVDVDFGGAASVYSEDIDGDGDMDVLGASFIDWDITWWENINGSGTSWVEHIIFGGFKGTHSVYSEDLDDDGDMDVLGAAWTDNDIIWWENTDGSGSSWIKHTIDGNFSWAWSVYSEDIDGDGEMDILGAAWNDGIIWWKLDAYPPGGSLISSILDTQGDPYWDYLDWNSHTPLGTSVSFRVRSSGDSNNMGAWSDTLTSPCLLESILIDGNRYVQYMAILETFNTDTTPTLNDVTISWDPTEIVDSEYPAILALLPFSPNPASAPVVRFSLPEPASVEISIFDMSGRLISEINGDEYSQGVHDVLLGNFNSGIHFCRMISGDFTAIQRFVVIE